MEIPEPIKLEISKAFRQLYFVDRSYGLGIWATDESKSKWEHDLAVMRLFQHSSRTCAWNCLDRTGPWCSSSASVSAG